MCHQSRCVDGGCICMRRISSLNTPHIHATIDRRRVIYDIGQKWALVCRASDGMSGPRRDQVTHVVHQQIEPPKDGRGPPVLAYGYTNMVIPLLLASVTSVASMITVLVLFMRPALKAITHAAEQAEITSKDLEKAAEEMERTALMFQNDLPLTMKEVQKASEEFELVGKQLNVIVSSVARPLTIEKPVEKAAESLSSVTKVAEKSTARFSRRIVHETTSVANTLWSSINQVAKQLGLRGVSNEAVEEAKRLVYIGRQQQEARTWIERWRWRTAMREAGKEDEEVKQLFSSGDTQKQSNNAPYNDVGYSPAVEQEDPDGIISRAMEALGNSPNENRFDGDDDPVSEVFSALARAQAAAEEAAVSSTALEKALQKAEESGMLSSSDEDDMLYD